jgi:hypothetical protein
MKRGLISAAMLSLLLFTQVQAWGEGLAITSVTPVAAPRGSSITLVGTLPAETTSFWLPPEKSGTLGHGPYDCTKKTSEIRTRLVTGPATTANNIQTFTVLIPESLALGSYSICASYPNAPAGGGPAQTVWYTVPILGDSGRLQVINETDAQALRVTAVQPRVSYPDKAGTGRQYRISVLGDGFSPVGTDNKVLLDGKEIAMCWDNDPACKSDVTKSSGKVIGTHQLDLQLPESYRGAWNLQIRVGANTSAAEPAVPITLSRIQRSTPIWVAVLMLVLIGLLISLLLGMTQGTNVVDRVHLSKLSSMFLDKATDTYSLSRAQFYAWTGAAVFGYSYLTIAWSFLQGRLEFVPIPENLPGILLASAGTTVVAEAVNNVKPKGAGPVQPEWADFICTGDVVVPERVQFLVWTILGIFSFVFVIVMSDPATIATLPSIPEGFLYLMGISSAGYLGGRLARKAGPIIDDILAKTGSLELTIRGRNLSKNACFQIDGEDVKMDMIGADENDQQLPKVIAKDDQAQDSNIAKILNMIIVSPKQNWMTRKSHPIEEKKRHLLAITNPDGQKAEWHFDLPGPTAIISHKGKKITDGKLEFDAGQVELDASESRAEKGELKYEWTSPSFPDNSNIKVVYPVASGTTTVNLKVTDAEERSNTTSVLITVV